MVGSADLKDDHDDYKSFRLAEPSSVIAQVSLSFSMLPSEIRSHDTQNAWYRLT